jgi:hypothetical protein
MNSVGQANPFSDASEYNALSFIIARAIEKMQTVSIVQVKAVNTGAKTVDVVVLVNIITAAGVSIPHGVIEARPYFRLQGGANAIICDPAAGDIGVMVFASRDSTAVIAAKGAANPGSNSQFSWADGLYFGGILNGAPTQYIQFLTSSVKIETALLTVTGNATIDGDVHGATLHAGNGWNGTFATGDSRTATVVDGIITSVI